MLQFFAGMLCLAGMAVPSVPELQAVTGGDQARSAHTPTGS